jgi:hypothetical protein
VTWDEAIAAERTRLLEQAGWRGRWAVSPAFGLLSGVGDQASRRGTRLQEQCRGKARVSGRSLAADAGAARDPLTKAVDPAVNHFATAPGSLVPPTTTAPVPISTPIKIAAPTHIDVDPTGANADPLCRSRGER